MLQDPQVGTEQVWVQGLLIRSTAFAADCVSAEQRHTGSTAARSSKRGLNMCSWSSNSLVLRGSSCWPARLAVQIRGPPIASRSAQIRSIPRSSAVSRTSLLLGFWSGVMLCGWQETLCAQCLLGNTCQIRHKARVARSQEVDGDVWVRLRLGGSCESDWWAHNQEPRDVRHGGGG